MTDREKFEAWFEEYTGWETDKYPNLDVVHACFEAWKAALASQNDGWIEWAGGDCPVAAGTLVDIRCRDGSQENGLRACFPEWARSKSATSTWWYRDNSPGDIIAYRVVKP